MSVADPRLSQASPVASPFHEGEQAVQTLRGVREEAEERGRKMISTALSPVHASFFGGLPFVLTSTVDQQAQPWAGLLIGDPGFIRVQDEHHLEVRPLTVASPPGSTVEPGAAIGLLGIDLQKRRRNRVNGSVVDVSGQSIAVKVDQAYGNCPKYITKRRWVSEHFTPPYSIEQSPGITASAERLIADTDTFFVATTSGHDPKADGTSTSSQPQAWGNDISHRGGRPGFLRQDQHTLWFEDYPGNNLFNTLGNLHRYNRCGFLIIDFDTGHALQLAARTELHYEGDRVLVSATVTQSRHWRRAAAACSAETRSATSSPTQADT